MQRLFLWLLTELMFNYRDRSSPEVPNPPPFIPGQLG